VGRSLADVAAMGWRVAAVMSCLLANAAVACAPGSPAQPSQRAPRQSPIVSDAPLSADVATRVCAAVGSAFERFAGTSSPPSIEPSVQTAAPASVECVVRPQPVGDVTRTVIAAVMSVPDPTAALTLVVGEDASARRTRFGGHDAVVSSTSGLHVAAGSRLINVVATKATTPTNATADPTLENAVAAGVLAVLDQP